MQSPLRRSSLGSLLPRLQLLFTTSTFPMHTPIHLHPNTVYPQSSHHAAPPLPSHPSAGPVRASTHDVERLCRILANQPSSGIEPSLHLSGVKVTPELVEEVLGRVSNGGVVALAFFRWAEKQHGFKYTTEGFHGLIEALGKIKQFGLVWNMVDAMKIKGLLTKGTFLLVARRYARAKKVKEAIETLEKMPRFGLEPDVSDYNKLIDVVSKSRHVRRAQEFFDEMKRKRRLSPDLKSYTILMEGWGKMQNLLRLKDVYDEMKDEGFQPDAVAYGILIHAYCKAKKFDEAVKMYTEMEAKSINPTPHIYCTLINGLGSNQRLDDALKFFELSKARGILPELPTYNAVVGAYCSEGLLHDAYRVLDEMNLCGLRPNTRTYDIIIHHLIKVGRTEEAYSIFQKMGSDQIYCDPGLNTYTVILAMLCSNGQLDEGVKVWEKMSEVGVIPCMHMFSSLINGLCAQQRLAEACSYFQQMMDLGIRPPGQLYGNLKQALINAGLRDLAFNLGQKLIELRETPLER